MPHLEEGVHPSDWHLDDESMEAARIGAEQLEIPGAIGALVSSTEPKALETAQAIAERWDAVVEPEPRLREAARPWIGPGYRAMAHRYLRGEDLDGWERHASVATRTTEAVDEAIGRAGGAPVVVVSHGLALTVHLGARLGADFDQESFWSGLAFPDAWALDADGVLHRSPPRARIS